MGAGKFGRLGAFVWTLMEASANRSRAFEAFRGSLREEADASRHGLDLQALAALRGRELMIAEKMLLRALPDPRAIAGLGALSTRRARRALARLFAQQIEAAEAARRDGCEDWPGAALIAAGLALWRVEPQLQYASAIVARLSDAPAWSERMDAAAALAEMPIAEVDRALNKALDDRDALVRHHAARSLLAIHGVDLDERATQRMVCHVMAGEAERRAAGRREMAATLSHMPVREVARRGRDCG